MKNTVALCQPIRNAHANEIDERPGDDSESECEKCQQQNNRRGRPTDWVVPYRPGFLAHENRLQHFQIIIECYHAEAEGVGCDDIIERVLLGLPGGRYRPETQQAENRPGFFQRLLGRS